MSLPLADLRVLDLTVARAGPTAVRQFADWGADVIRVEPPAGRGGMGSGPRDGSDFQNLHRGKRCITLDLKSEKGRRLLYDLVEGADVLIENFRVPVKHRLKVSYDDLRPLNPRLIYGSISGFGQDGPYSDRGGVDQIAQGLGGLMSITGVPGQGPVRVGVPISDLSAGVYLAMGVLVALHERERTGEGQWVRTSLLEAMVAMLDFQAVRYTVDGEVPEQAGNHHPTGIPMGTFPTSDGYMNVAGPSGRLWRAFCTVLGAPELIDDPAYVSAGLRSENRDELNDRIAQITATRSTDDWIAALNEAGVPCGPVNDIGQTMNDPQVEHLGMRSLVHHPERGDLGVIRNAVTMGDGTEPLGSAAPEAGQHTDEVLAEIGVGADRRAELRSAGII
ncbi:MAG: CoA transferase [Actinomycetia bacterium]|nr:CoA transferase [Actinomycetes bacterium]